MRKTKGILILIIAAIIFICGVFSVFYFTKEQENKKIVVTNFPTYDICRKILKSDNDIMVIEENGLGLHSFSTLKLISKAELFIYIGGESDSWVEDELKSANNINLITLRLFDTANKLVETSEGILSSSHEHNHEHSDEKEHSHSNQNYDEHIWLSITNMKIMTNEIMQKLIIVFPEFKLYPQGRCV